MKLANQIKLVGLVLCSLALFSCETHYSRSTGYEYNNSRWGGFEKIIGYPGMETPPGMVFVEGGTYSFGQSEQLITYEHHNHLRRMTVSSFYMDETETTNLHYREYLYWVKRTYYADFPEVWRRALPDTLVWRSRLAYNEPMTEWYLRHPAYQDYPVVGVNWMQATDFCKWRTNRINEMIMVRDGFLELNINAINEDNFNTKAYRVNQYEGVPKRFLHDYNPNSGTGERRVREEDGIILPDVELPTETQWEFAAKAIIGNIQYPGAENNTDRRLYTWGTEGISKYTLRYWVHGGWMGEMLANYKRGRGDNMGIAGGLNDNADITAPGYAYMPNDYGLYNMAGNVSEWVKDVYRALSHYDIEDFNGFRGNDFMRMELEDPNAPEFPAEKDSLGRMIYIPVPESENVNRRNYRKSNYRGFRDAGETGRGEDDEWDSKSVYDFGVSTLVNNKARIYKGGSWNDRAYYITPGARRWLDEEQATAAIGFRCIMPRLGSPQGNPYRAGNWIMRKNKGYE